MMGTILWVLFGIALFVAVITFIVLWMHYPSRKWMIRAFDKTWDQRSRLPDFSPERIAVEEADMFVSSTVMRDACDIIWDEFDDAAPDSLTASHPDGTVIWVNTMLVKQFIEDILPRITFKFVLVTARENNPTRFFDIETVLANDNLLCWFIENYEFDRKFIDTGRIVPLPLGLNYHKLDPNSPNRSGDMGTTALPGAQQAQLKDLAEGIAPISERPLKVYCNFQLNMDTFLRHHHALPRAKARAEAITVFKDSPLAIIEPRQTTRNDVWMRHHEAAFEASPRGNSIDCHRTWEALLLKSIPIVKSTEMDPIYEGLPVVIINDWSDVTEATLKKWLADFAPWFDQPLPSRLFSNHWIARFHAWKPEDARPRLSGHVN